MTDETDKRSTHSLGFYVGLFLFAVLVVYPLSVGPAVYIHRKFKLQGTMAETALGVVYWPLETAARQGPRPIAQPLDAYVGYFRWLAEN